MLFLILLYYSNTFLVGLLPMPKDLAEQEESVPELKTIELPEEISHDYLTDLIDQPAWKTILLTIVKQEKMDPWDIDLVHLADKYLEKINSLEQANLRVPANAMLASTILLKTKSKSLRITTLEELEEESDKQELSAEEKAMLLSGIPELRNSRGVREGKVTLDELVKTIEVMLNKSKRKNSFASKLEEVRFHIPFSEVDIEQKMIEVRALVKQKADSQGMLLFSQLADKNPSPTEVINIFIPLLFLANKGELAIWQEAFWEEIFISLQKRIEVRPGSDSEPAISEKISD